MTFRKYSLKVLESYFAWLGNSFFGWAWLGKIGQLFPFTRSFTILVRGKIVQVSPRKVIGKSLKKIKKLLEITIIWEDDKINLHETMLI